MPRGENEAFKAQQGKGGFAASVEKAREAGRKGGRVKKMTMHDFKRLAQEMNTEQTDKGKTRGEVMLNNLQNEAAHGNVKAMKLWLEIMQFGEPKNIDITSGGERLPNIVLVPTDGRTIKQSEDEIEE